MKGISKLRKEKSSLYVWFPGPGKCLAGLRFEMVACKVCGALEWAWVVWGRGYSIQKFATYHVLQNTTTTNKFALFMFFLSFF